MSKRWRIRPHDLDRIAALERAAGLSPVVAQLLVQRGIEHPQVALGFLNPKLTDLRDPAELPGATAAAERIWRAVQDKKRVVVYGDYDVDGIAGTSILYLALRLLGANVGYYIPHRLDEGYGLNGEAIAALAREGVGLVVTVDCGITSVDEAILARRAGVELVVTDHHAMRDELPGADVLVHPRLPGHSYPFGDLSGSGVAFKVAWALCQMAEGSKRVSPPMREFLLQAVVLAALGAVADVVPLLDENRVLVHYGLMGLKQTQNVGLKALLKVSGLASKARLSSDDIGFGLAPRLNAAGRLGQARLAVELFTTPSEPRAMELAQYVEELNENRKSLERSIYLAANKQAQERFDPAHDSALVLADRGWHAGVIGIVAGRLAERYHRPVVLISLDDLAQRPALGSARSVPGFKLHEALATCGEHLLTHGGHAAAAGLRIAEESVESFRLQFCDYAEGQISLDDRIAELHIDAETTLAALTLRTVTQIEQLAPFGEGNERPLLCATGVDLVGQAKKIGGGERHLSLRFSHYGVTLRAVAFGAAERAEELERSPRALAVAFRPQINVFAGQRSVELEVVDWKPAAELAAKTH
ncbi:MAG: single-stranded-DNA-specific exonuclease RecJ [Planctomycetia bacterium]|nr:single-stranded-DNA-specific exonuclease RecJ [Planctomycetia bacterium]